MFQRLAVHQKVILILSMTVLPVLGLLVLYVVTIGRLQAVEQEVNRFFELQLQTDHILEQIVDVQYGFRGFVLTKDEKFLAPYYAAAESLAPAIHRLKMMVMDNEDHLRRIADFEMRIRLLLQQKQRLIDNVRLGQMGPVRNYIESGQGQAALNEIRSAIQDFVVSEMAIRRTLQDRADRLAALSSYGLAGGIAAMAVMWWIGSRLLARNITRPIAALTDAAQQFGLGSPVGSIPVGSTDELGRLARTMEVMQERIAHHRAQLEAFHAIGKERSTIGPDLRSRLEQLERYSADMAHDLKGPARRMAELASLLQMDYKGRFDERADRYLVWIRENGQQLMARIEEVLRLARLGAVREIIEPVDPAEVVRDVLKGCESHIERLGVRVRVAQRFPKLACNRVHLFQVMDNLIRNALKFSAEGRPLELEIGILHSAKETVLFVRDNGIGIAPADKERIFEPFERLGHQEAPGTGIGLAIVKKIIELYQGRVWVESEPGKGAAVFFALPLYGELAAVEAVQERVQS